MVARVSQFWEERRDELAALARRVKSNDNPEGDLTWEDVGRTLGVTGAAARMKYREIKSTLPDPDLTTVEGPLGRRVKSLDDLLRECKVDQSEWLVERWVANKWEVGAKHPTTGEILTAPLYQVKAWLKRHPERKVQRAIWDAMLADLTAKAPKAPAIKHKRPAEDPHLLEVAAVDAHFGKLAWVAETRENYDLGIARACFRDAIADLIRKARGFPLEEALFVVGNDGMHFDNYQQTTTGGTFQDADTRYPKMFSTYWQECRWAIDQLKHMAPVKVVVVPGNHDRQSAYCVGEVLAAWYAAARDGAVTVDNRPKLRKFHRYGVTLLGFTHGSEEKHQDLPLIMASEEPELWAQTLHREWHTGHFHKAKETRFTAADSFGGVRVRILPSLAGHDAWHYMKGFNVERRAAEAYLYHKATGYAGHFSSNILPEVAA